MIGHLTLPLRLAHVIMQHTEDDVDDVCEDWIIVQTTKILIYWKHKIIFKLWDVSISVIIDDYFYYRVSISVTLVLINSS